MFRSVSTGKSSLNWLERLRTAKGFNDDGPAELENFLQNPNSVDPKPNSDPTQNEDTQLFNIMSNVLNELFIFGDNRSNSTQFKKSARKQKNPRICDVGREKENAATEKVTLQRSRDGEGVKELDNYENGGRDVDLVGFSRTEVTVIDTSYESWKFDKFLYRKRNVWKVRDKKVNGESVCIKRKLKESGRLEEEQRVGKKTKVDKNQGNEEGLEFPSNEMNVREVCKTSPEDGTMKTKQLDSKLNDGSSSVILIKSIHTSKKNGPSISKSCLKSKQKRTMLIGGSGVEICQVKKVG
ncbi:dihydroxy-acid dehydratase [Striga asiatica]|uniref:Dihydroxy-acid dehydratase n=1 Tax=Striga asiatica TaxID=4170 RepID=A0A5A7PC73_STRAF|nr:dihydroxy-acid dehydratase [Striga asiatica]